MDIRDIEKNAVEFGRVDKLKYIIEKVDETLQKVVIQLNKQI
jgi:hypothetical protein